jgi:hypothetical protein
MAFFTWSRSVAAGASDNPLAVSGNDWKYNRAPYDAIIEVMQRTTAAGVVSTITAGSDEIMQECPMSAGGTAGVFTGRLNLEPITFTVKAGDVIQLRNRNTTAGALTVDGTIEMTRKG